MADDVVDRHAGPAGRARPRAGSASRLPSAARARRACPTPSRRRASSRSAGRSTCPLAEALAGTPRLVVLCDQVRDPGNLGTVIRCADAFGADAVLVVRRLGRPLQPQDRPRQHRQPVPPAARVGVDLADAVADAAHRRPAGARCRRAARRAPSTTWPHPASSPGRRSGSSATRPGACRPTTRRCWTAWSPAADVRPGREPQPLHRRRARLSLRHAQPHSATHAAAEASSPSNPDVALRTHATGRTSFLDCPGRRATAQPSCTKQEPMSGPNTSYDPVQVAPLERRARRGHGGRGARGVRGRDLGWPSSSRPGWPTPATGRRSPWPTGRSARCRRRPARTPARGSARPAGQINTALQGPRGRDRARPS